MRSLPATGLLALSIALLAACSGESQPAAEEAISTSPPPVVYEVRGVIADLPPEGQPLDWMAIQHEAVPDFVGIDGEVEPMHTMTMRFPVGEGVDLSSSAVGDKIAFELEVDWEAGEPARVLAMSPLPAETELDFGGG